MAMLNIGQGLIHFRQFANDLFSNIAELLGHLYIKVYFSILFILNASIWFFSYYAIKNIHDTEIALHYNVDFGIDYYGSSKNVFIIPAIALLILLINVGILLNFRKSKDRKFISHILLLSALVSHIILFTALLSIYLINTR